MTSGAVASALGSYIKVHTTSNITISANNWSVSSGGKLWKPLGNVPDVIGTNHTLIAVFICYFTQCNNYPLEVVTDDNAYTYGVQTTNQACSGTIKLRFVYV